MWWWELYPQPHNSAVFPSSSRYCPPHALISPSLCWTLAPPQHFISTRTASHSHAFMSSVPRALLHHRATSTFPPSRRLEESKGQLPFVLPFVGKHSLKSGLRACGTKLKFPSPHSGQWKLQPELTRELDVANNRLSNGSGLYLSEAVVIRFFLENFLIYILWM